MYQRYFKGEKFFNLSCEVLEIVNQTYGQNYYKRKEINRYIWYDDATYEWCTDRDQQGGIRPCLQDFSPYQRLAAIVHDG